MLRLVLSDVYFNRILRIWQKIFADAKEWRAITLFSRLTSFFAPDYQARSTWSIADLLSSEYWGTREEGKEGKVSIPLDRSDDEVWPINPALILRFLVGKTILRTYVPIESPTILNYSSAGAWLSGQSVRDNAATAHSTNLLDTHGELPRASTCKDKKWPKVVRVALEEEGTFSHIRIPSRSRTEGSTKFGYPTRPRPPHNDVNRRLLSEHLISTSRTIKRRLILRSFR